MQPSELILPMMGITIPIIAILGGVGIALTAFKHQARRAELEHQERMLAIEKGVPLPPAMLPPVRRRNPYVFGFILIGVGLAMIIAMNIEGDPDWGWGLTLLLPGLGILLANWLFSRSKALENGRASRLNGGSDLAGTP
jgi:hypothetical protein